MRKYIILILTAVLIPLSVGAIIIENPLRGSADNLWELIDRLITFIFNIALAVTPIMLVIAGFYYLTAMGEVEKVNTAKKIILYTLIGLIIIISAKGMIELFQELFLRQP